MTDMPGKLITAVFMFALLFTQTSLAEPLYWKAEKGNREFLLFGSIHMGTPDMYPLPEKVLNHLKSSNGLITEIDLSAVAEHSVYATTETVRDVLTLKQQKTLTSIATELSLPPQVLFDRPAWQTALVLQVTQFVQLGFSRDYGIDQYMTDMALSRNIPVTGLETPDYQLQLFSKDNHTGRVLLIDTIKHWEKNKQINRCLIKSWKAGDKNKLVQLADESEIETDLTERFIYRRNQNWAEQLDNPQFLPETGKYTVVVGALHLVGPKNLISLLQQKGYQITRLSRSKTVSCQLQR